MLFKGTATRIGRRHRAGDRFDRRPARRVHREGIRQLLHQGARRAPAARDRHPLRHRPQPGVQRRRHRAREEGRRSKRSRWSRTRRTISSTSSSRRASGRIIRSAGRFSARAETVESFNADAAARLFQRTPTPRANLIVSAVGNLEHERVRELVEREVRIAAAEPASRSRTSRRTVVPKILDPQQGARAEPPLPRRRAAIRRITTIAMRATC